MNIQNESADVCHKTDDEASPRHDDGLEMAHLQGSQAENQERGRMTTSETRKGASGDTDARSRAKIGAEAASLHIIEPRQHIESQNPQDARIPAYADKDGIRLYDDNLLKAQVKQVVAMVEGPNSDPKKSLLDILRECIPMDSPLSYSTRQYRVEKVTILSGGRVSHSYHSPKEITNETIPLKTAESNVMVIHDISNDWCEELCSRYPDSISQLFLLEHVFGFRLPLSTSTLDDMPGDFDKILGESTPACIRHRVSRVCDRLDGRKRTHGFHISCWRTPKHKLSQFQRQPEFRRIDGRWDKTNGFVSCCRLADNLCKYITGMSPMTLSL